MARAKGANMEEAKKTELETIEEAKKAINSFLTEKDKAIFALMLGGNNER